MSTRAASSSPFQGSIGSALFDFVGVVLLAPLANLLFPFRRMVFTPHFRDVHLSCRQLQTHLVHRVSDDLRDGKVGNHLWFAGIMYQGACFVFVKAMASSYASIYCGHSSRSE